MNASLTAFMLVGGETDAEEEMPRDGSEEISLEFLNAFADAWNRHDADAILSMMTADCIMETSFGHEACGTRYGGQAGVRRGILEVFETFPDARWNEPRHFVAGDRAVSEWVFAGTRRDGFRVKVNGCDLFTFRDGKIALKNSYRKQRA